MKNTQHPWRAFNSVAGLRRTGGIYPAGFILTPLNTLAAGCVGCRRSTVTGGRATQAPALLPCRCHGDDREITVLIIFASHQYAQSSGALVRRATLCDCE